MSKPLPTIIVQGAIDILSDPKRWCREKLACDIHGNAIHMSSMANAAGVAFCAVGALYKSTYALTCDEREVHDLVSVTCQQLEALADDVALSHINDRRGRLSILQLFTTYLEKSHA